MTDEWENVRRKINDLRVSLGENSAAILSAPAHAEKSESRTPPAEEAIRFQDLLSEQAHKLDELNTKISDLSAQIESRKSSDAQVEELRKTNNTLKENAASFKTHFEKDTETLRERIKLGQNLLMRERQARAHLESEKRFCAHQAASIKDEFFKLKKTALQTKTEFNLLKEKYDLLALEYRKNLADHRILEKKYQDAEKGQTLLQNQIRQNTQNFKQRFQNELKNFEFAVAGFAKNLETGTHIVKGILKKIPHYKTDGEAKHAFALAEKYIEKFSTDLEDLTRYSQMNLGQPQTVEILQILNAVISENLQKANEKNCRILKGEERPLRGLLLGNKELLKSAFEEIVGNAVDFSPSNEEVLIQARNTGNNIVLDFFNKRALPHEPFGEKTFEPYFTTRKGYRGLGLTRAKRALEIHGGAIRFDDTTSDGVTVSVTLPLQTEESL